MVPQPRLPNIPLVEYSIEEHPPQPCAPSSNHKTACSAPIAGRHSEVRRRKSSRKHSHQTHEHKEKQDKLKSIAVRIEAAMEGARAGRGHAPGVLHAMLPFDPPVVMGDEYVMAPKIHGTSWAPVRKPLRWGCDHKLADHICNFNRCAAEEAGYFEGTQFLQDAKQIQGEITFYDSNTCKPLFNAPRDRTWDEFVQESKKHGWPSFRDAEVNWGLVRVLPGGETVSIHGTHLGHLIPDRTGNRYCINLVSVAGAPPAA